MTLDPRIARAFEAENGFALAPHLVVLAPANTTSIAFAAHMRSQLTC